MDSAEINDIPSMVFHGVKSREAVALRMLNVPRIVSEGLAQEWREKGAVNISDANLWVSNTSGAVWQRALPQDSKISGEECRRMWEIYEGKAKWSSIYD